MAAKKAAFRPVIVCTKYKGVFFGYAEDTTGINVSLKEARMAIRWRTTRGVFELAEVGPNSDSTISAKADVDLRDVTAVMEVSPAAEKAWKECK